MDTADANFLDHRIFKPEEIVGGVERASPAGGGIFVLHVNRVLPQSHYTVITEQWRKIWELAGRDPAPPILVLAHDMRLEAIGGAELEKMGLMRLAEAPKV